VEPHASSVQKFLVGYGGSSAVYWCHEKGRKIAIKEFLPVFFDQLKFVRETETLFKLNHPCVVKIISYSLPTTTMAGEIHMEYAPNGSLAHVFKRKRTAGMPTFWNATGISVIVCGILLGLRFVHECGFIHRDLKPSNILITDEGKPLIADFGAARYESSDSTSTQDAGTIHYAAPEMFKEVDHTTKVDVFSFGLILYEILLGHPVFTIDQTAFEIMGKITQGTMPDIPEQVLPAIKAIILRCWSLDPTQRPSINDILENLRSLRYEIVSGANGEEVAAYVDVVRAWEERNKVMRSNLDFKLSTPGSRNEGD
jgi:serine/threonine protein kinase